MYKGTMDLDALPDKVLVKVLSQLRTKDQVRAGLVCRRWAHLTRTGGQLWTRVALSDKEWPVKPQKAIEWQALNWIQQRSCQMKSLTLEGSRWSTQFCTAVLMLFRSQAQPGGQLEDLCLKLFVDLPVAGLVGLCSTLKRLEVYLSSGEFGVDHSIFLQDWSTLTSLEDLTFVSDTSDQASSSLDPQEEAGRRSSYELSSCLSTLTSLTSLRTKLSSCSSLDVVASLSHLRCLDVTITSQQFEEGFPSALLSSSLSALSSLTLHYDWAIVNSLTVPSGVGDMLPGLQQLHLLGQEAYFNHMDISAISELTGLQSLTLYNMNLESFPKCVTALTDLIDLDVAFNPINVAGAGLSNLNKLRRLNLTGTGWKVLPVDITTLQNLRVLGWNNDTSTEFTPRTSSSTQQMPKLVMDGDATMLHLASPAGARYSLGLTEWREPVFSCEGHFFAAVANGDPEALEQMRSIASWMHKQVDWAQQPSEPLVASASL